MKRFPTIAAGTMLALSLVSSGPVEAQTSRSSPGAKFVNRILTGGPHWASVDGFDVAGVKLGMTPEEARRALTSAGFVPPATDPTQDAWSAVVSRRVVERIGGKVNGAKIPMFTRARGLQGETVEVWYAATKDGARVSSIDLRMPTRRMERAAFTASVMDKYGRPTVNESARVLYCTKGEDSCLTYQNKLLPYLSVESSYALHSVKLAEGRRYGEDLKASTAAAVEAAAPKNAKASF